MTALLAPFRILLGAPLRTALRLVSALAVLLAFGALLDAFTLRHAPRGDILSELGVAYALGMFAAAVGWLRRRV